MKNLIRYSIARKMLLDPASSVTFAKIFSKMVSSFSALNMSAECDSFCVYSKISSSSAVVNDWFFWCMVMIVFRGLSCEKA